MKGLPSFLLVVIVLSASAMALGAEFRLYPGARADAWCARYARQAEAG